MAKRAVVKCGDCSYCSPKQTMDNTHINDFIKKNWANRVTLVSHPPPPPPPTIVSHPSTPQQGPAIRPPPRLVVRPQSPIEQRTLPKPIPLSTVSQRTLPKPIPLSTVSIPFSSEDLRSDAGLAKNDIINIVEVEVHQQEHFLTGKNLVEKITVFGRNKNPPYNTVLTDPSLFRFIVKNCKCPDRICSECPLRQQNYYLKKKLEDTENFYKKKISEMEHQIKLKREKTKKLDQVILNVHKNAYWTRIHNQLLKNAKRIPKKSGGAQKKILIRHSMRKLRNLDNSFKKEGVVLQDHLKKLSATEK